MIEILATGIVYRNPVPHLRAVHAWHPSLVHLGGDEFLASFDLGQGVESLDYRTHLARSLDRGRTWSAPEPLFQETTQRPSSHSVRLGRAADGTLVAMGARFHRDDPSEGLVNRENLGYLAMDLVLLTSGDGGRTWTGPRTIQPPLVGPSFETCAPVRELSNGRWIYPTSTWKGWDGSAPSGMNAVALVSHDRGRTWPDHLPMFAGYDRGVIHWEVSVVELADRRLLAVAWAVDEASGKTLPTPFSLLAKGSSFDAPRPNGLSAQTAKLTVLPDGRVLCLYRRDDRPGLWAEVARIDGDRWTKLGEAPLWQGAASGMTGKATAADELSGLKFGYPSAAVLPGSEVLVLFWCVEDCIHNIRWLTMRVAS